ncbi:hypothetical protein VSF3289_01224 [Vibrio scophthalmi]|uniref:Uncharacterized protein n=1 Tax=Vibrio scophthalmi TaxID=45658 RepID=A0A1E3WMF9_9VIBR|nr:hypothetical protein VSF3289_01224 [Vibrio scophthalmi]
MRSGSYAVNSGVIHSNSFREEFKKQRFGLVTVSSKRTLLKESPVQYLRTC